MHVLAKKKIAQKTRKSANINFGTKQRNYLYKPSKVTFILRFHKTSTCIGSMDETIVHIFGLECLWGLQAFSSSLQPKSFGSLEFEWVLSSGI